MIRLFAGLSIPVLLRQRLTTLQGGIPGARWQERENFHITLAFIGDVDERTAEAADEALAQVRTEPFELRLEGTGSFSTGSKLTALWIGVSHSEVLHRLKEKTDRALQRAGVPFDNRKYTPHVTLAHLRGAGEGKVAEFMQAHNLFRTEPFQVDEFLLYRSHQTKNGSAYEPVAEYPLAARG